MSTPAELIEATHNAEGHYYKFRMTSNEATSLSGLFGLPRSGNIRRFRFLSDSGTVLPRLLRPTGAAGAAVHHDSVVATCPGVAAISDDRLADVPYAAPEGEAKLQLQGTGTGRTVICELWIRPNLGQS